MTIPIVDPTMDPLRATDRFRAVAIVCLLNLDAIDFYFSAPSDDMYARLKRVTALWNCLAEIEGWLRESEPPPPDAIDWDVHESFSRIYQRALAEHAQMKRLCPGLHCKDFVRSRLAPPLPHLGDAVLMRLHAADRIAWTLVE